MSKLIRFTSPTCGMCHNVASRMAKAGINCEVIDVSTDEGMERANYYDVQHLPVVIEFDEYGSIINRYDNYGAIINLVKSHVVS